MTTTLLLSWVFQVVIYVFTRSPDAYLPLIDSDAEVQFHELPSLTQAYTIPSQPILRLGII